MATASGYNQLPPAATRQSNFEQGVAYALHLWPALTLSVQNQWGGPESADKRDWFAGAIVDLFPEFEDTTPAQNSSRSAPTIEEPDIQDVETVLLQVMVDEFDVNVDDDSGYEVAGQIVQVRTQCANGQFDEVQKLSDRFANRKAGKVDQLFKKAEDADQDTDWESDDGEDDDESNADDVNMSDATGAIAAPKEKSEPQVDEDGFTMVTKKKR